MRLRVSYVTDDKKVVPPKARRDEALHGGADPPLQLYTEGFHVPKGEVYAAVEAPKGEFGRLPGRRRLQPPYRCKIRAPGFTTCKPWDYMIRGHMLADVSAILGSLDIVFGEIDR